MRKLSGFMAALLFLLQTSTPAFASVSTPSDAELNIDYAKPGIVDDASLASSSDAEMDFDADEFMNVVTDYPQIDVLDSREISPLRLNVGSDVLSGSSFSSYALGVCRPESDYYWYSFVQTISYQLEALWDQMYNYMHLEQLRNDDKNTDRIINKLGDDLSVEIQNQNDNSQKIIDNDNKNTNTIVNGYDNSGMNGDNDRLNASLNEYGKAEDTVMDSVNDSLNNFTFGDSLDSYIVSVALVSDFLQRMYESSGSFKDVINIGFFLSIAGIVIGLYRFKEG